MDRAKLSEAKRFLEQKRAVGRGRAQVSETELLPPEKRNLKRRVMEALELPQDVVLDVPRIVIIGNFQLAIENHRGLAEYTPDRVSIGVAKGRLSITGQSLTIGTISGEEITVLGEITSISFDG